MSGEDHVDPKLVRMIKDQEEKDGVMLALLPVGTVVEVQTRNTLYVFTKLTDDTYGVTDECKRCKGGEIINIHGSTWGGSTMHLGWIGIGMRVEITHPTKEDILTTSFVRTIKVIGDDGAWDYTIREKEDG